MKEKFSNYIKKMAMQLQAQYYDVDPEMLLKLFQDYLNSMEEDWNYVLPTDYYELMKKGEAGKYFLVDLRRMEDYKKGHIPGAINIFWLDILKEENLKKLPVNKEILIYCYVGHTSSQVAVLLNLLGYKVKALKFGMGISPDEKVEIKGWKDYGYPLE
jgi:rhodanese-related sulfurtransferase